MNGKQHQSWGRYPNVNQEIRNLYWRNDPLPITATGNKFFLPFGNGRSYGDVCLNDGGVLLDCRRLDRLIRFEPSRGVLRCEAGLLLSEILGLIVPKGWFLPVTPGTRFVTIGGSIANDVHGKNHRRAGTFGCHVRCFELLRSDGTRLLCSPKENIEFYEATIGGLGLTGVITWAEIQLRRIDSAFIDYEVVRFGNLPEFFKLAGQSEYGYEYTAAWMDCSARSNEFGRGLFKRGSHVAHLSEMFVKSSTSGVKFPVELPFTLINGVTSKLFNKLYYRTQGLGPRKGLVNYEPFLFPLDIIRASNRIYGPKGFLQYQCVLPKNSMEDAIREILQHVSKAGIAPSLAILKSFGEKSSPGLLSFPLPGTTLALDFPNIGENIFRLLDKLAEITCEAGGHINPSKDARMRPDVFKSMYRNWNVMKKYIDPKFSSSFWRRVMFE